MNVHYLVEINVNLWRYLRGPTHMWMIIEFESDLGFENQARAFEDDFRAEFVSQSKV